MYTDFDSTHFGCFLWLKLTIKVSVQGQIKFVQLSTKYTRIFIYLFIFSTHELSEFIHIPHVFRHVLC